jgi:hypothetical protein
MADYYNAIPDGVVDDRFSVPHSDFTSPEYQNVSEIEAKKWEECRGLGRSFGYNRAEGERSRRCSLYPEERRPVRNSARPSKIIVHHP